MRRKYFFTRLYTALKGHMTCIDQSEATEVM